jgi:hypothetical protein
LRAKAAAEHARNIFLRVFFASASAIFNPAEAVLGRWSQSNLQSQIKSPFCKGLFIWLTTIEEVITVIKRDLASN